MKEFFFDDKAFNDLFKSNFRDLMRFVVSYVNDEEVAKDVVHDVFVMVLRNQKKLDTSYPIRSYLFTLARNCALDYLKHLRVVAMNEREMCQFLESTEEELDVYEKRLMRVNAKLAELPEKQREVLLKCFVEGKKYKKVADEMKISVNSVKTHVSRGLKFLRDELREEMVLLLLFKKRGVRDEFYEGKVWNAGVRVKSYFHM